MPTFYVAQPLGYSIQTGEIDNKAVTYPKIQDVSATDKVLGRETAGAGVVEEIACTAAGRALLDDANAAAQRTTLGLGNVALETAPLAVAKGGTALAALGAALAILRTNSGATAAEWAAIEAAIRDAISGSGSQVLRRNAGNTALEFATASGGQEIKIAVATWTTNFTTTNITLTDITNATITLSGLTAGTTYTLIAIASSSITNAGSGVRSIAALLIDDTNSATTQFSPANASGDYVPYSLAGAKAGVTGATSYISKLQLRTTNAGNAAGDNGNVEKGSIVLIAIAN